MLVHQIGLPLEIADALQIINLRPFLDLQLCGDIGIRRDHPLVQDVRKMGDALLVHLL